MVAGSSILLPGTWGRTLVMGQWELLAGAEKLRHGYFQSGLWAPPGSPTPGLGAFCRIVIAASKGLSPWSGLRGWGSFLALGPERSLHTLGGVGSSSFNIPPHGGWANLTKPLLLSLHLSPCPCTPLEETARWAFGPGLAMLPAHSVFVSNPRKSWGLWDWELILPAPVFSLLFLSPSLYPQQPSLPLILSPTSPKSFQSDKCRPKSNPHLQGPAGISPGSPIFLLLLCNPATLLTPTPAIPLCGQLSKCSPTSPFQSIGPVKQLQKVSSSAKVLLQIEQQPLAGAIGFPFPGSGRPASSPLYTVGRPLGIYSQGHNPPRRLIWRELPEGPSTV